MKFDLGLYVPGAEPFRVMYKVRDFSIFYSVIKQADLCLKNIPTIPEDEFTDYDTQYNQYIGEAYFLKAFSYFYMARVWGDVPVIDNTDPDIVDLKNYKRESEEKVIIKAIEDCTTALKYLNWEYTNNEDRAVRANAGAAWALLAHLNAWVGNYSACEAAAEKVLEKGYYSYISRSRFTDIFEGQSDEAIFEISQNSGTEAQFGSGASLTNFLLRGPYFRPKLNDTQTTWQFDLGTLKQDLFDNPQDLRRTNGFDYFATDYLNTQT